MLFKIEFFNIQFILSSCLRHGRCALNGICSEGESPFMSEVERHIAESNCVVERQGGEQLETKDQSVG